ncbi:uncharacterized protein Dvar_52320 [Desulfosarcina variabilis str. Montpellier]
MNRLVRQSSARRKIDQPHTCLNWAIVELAAYTRQMSLHVSVLWFSADMLIFFADLIRKYRIAGDGRK